jgi:pimeloyl-ACP methyl ester carboxylesterase
MNKAVNDSVGNGDPASSLLPERLARLAAKLERAALEADPEILIQQHREMHRGLDFLAAPTILGTISSPTLVVHGELDLSVPLAVAEAVAAAIPGAALAVALAGGRRPDIRSPELFNPLLVEFPSGRQLTARPGIEIRQ